MRVCGVKNRITIVIVGVLVTAGHACPFYCRMYIISTQFVCVCVSGLCQYFGKPKSFNGRFAVARSLITLGVRVC